MTNTVRKRGGRKLRTEGGVRMRLMPISGEKSCAKLETDSCEGNR